LIPPYLVRHLSDGETRQAKGGLIPMV
jgi:hypothetical protein